MTPDRRNEIPGSNRAVNVPLVGESILYSVFKKGNRLTTDHVAKLERMLHSTLKAYDSENQSRARNGMPITALDVAVEIYSQLATEYVELLAGVIPLEEQTGFCAAPEAFAKVKIAEIPDLVRRKLALLTLAHCNSWNLSKAIIKLIRMGAAADLKNGRLF